MTTIVLVLVAMALLIMVKNVMETPSCPFCGARNKEHDKNCQWKRREDALK